MWVSQTFRSNAKHNIRLSIQSILHLIHRPSEAMPMKNSEYDQEIPQSQTTDNPMAPRGRVAQPPRDTRKTN